MIKPTLPAIEYFKAPFESIDKADEASLAFCQNLVRELGLNCVITGLIRGTDPNDIKPILLVERSRLTLYRRIRVDLGLFVVQTLNHTTLKGYLLNVLESLIKNYRLQLSWLNQFYPEEPFQFWIAEINKPIAATTPSDLSELVNKLLLLPKQVITLIFKRPYFEENFSLPLETVAEQLIDYLKFNRSNNLVHGHLSLSNFAVIKDTDQIAILDPFCKFYPHNKTALDIAPEVKHAQHGIESFLGSGNFWVDTYGMAILLTQYARASQQKLPSSWHSKLADIIAGKRFAPEELLQLSYNASYSRVNNYQVKDTLNGNLSSKRDSQDPPEGTRERDTDSKSSSLIILIMIVGIISCGAIYAIKNPDTIITTFIESMVDFNRIDMWSSAESDDRLKVIQDFINSNNDESYRLIRSSIISNNIDSTLFNPIMLRLVTSYARELNRQDFRHFIALATNPQYLSSTVRLVTLPNTIHSIIALGALVSLSTPEAIAVFQKYDLANLEKLPGKLGVGVNCVSKGIPQKDLLTDLNLFLRLALGIDNVATVSNFLFGRDDAVVLLKARCLVKTLPNNEVSIVAEKFNRSFPEISSELLEWFQGNPIWQSFTKSELLEIALGEIGRKAGSKHLLDLLYHPFEEIRLIAGQVLVKLPEYREISSLIEATSKNNGSYDLDRSLWYTLVLTLLNGGFEEWFRLNPPPLSVVKVIADLKSKKFVQFHLLAIRYIKQESKGLKTSIENLEKLVSHPEPLVRAFAIAKLDPKLQWSHNILEKRANLEKSPRLKSEILRKLEKISR